MTKREYGEVVPKEKLEKMTEEERRRLADQSKSPIIAPSDAEVEAIRQVRHTCGECKNFNYRAGQEAARDENIWQAVQEEGHKQEWYSDPSTYGLCDAWDGTLVFRDMDARISRWVTDSSYVGPQGYIQEGGMERIPCPAFKPRTNGGQAFSISRSGKRQMDF